MKIICEQFKPRLGDLGFNAGSIIDKYNQGATQGADVIIFTELCVSGYIPKDLLFSKHFLQGHNQCFSKIVDATKNKDTYLILPTFKAKNNKLYNACYVIADGEVVFKIYKQNLAKDSVFDEARYFSPSKSSNLTFKHKGVSIGLAICEDFWQANYYKKLAKQEPDLVVVVNASPYDVSKVSTRLNTLQQRTKQLNKPVIYVNQVLAQDGILYDGNSFVYDTSKTYINKNSFTEDTFACNFNKANSSLIIDKKDLSKFEEVEQKNISKFNFSQIYKALVFGLKEYVYQSGFSKVLVGLSGGIDSALVATIASDAFGSKNVKAIFMPSTFTTKQSFKDAEDTATNLQIELKAISIEELRLSYNSLIANLSPLAMENTQARIRGGILMAVSNSDGSLLLTTGNKSEIATGYCTLYGDMCGAYNPIKDLYKTEVFEVSKWRNNNILDFMQCKKLNIINDSLLTKAPSAELRENQKDCDSLPDYPILDQILYCLIEQRLSPQEANTKLSSLEVFKDIKDLQGLIDKVHKLFKISEYKRRQSALGTKISSLSFEPSDRRVNL